MANIKELEERVTRLEKQAETQEKRLTDCNGQPLIPWRSVVKAKTSNFCVLVTGGHDSGKLRGYWLDDGYTSELEEKYEFLFNLSPEMSAKYKKMFDC